LETSLSNTVKPCLKKKKKKTEFYKMYPVFSCVSLPYPTLVAVHVNMWKAHSGGLLLAAGVGTCATLYPESTFLLLNSACYASGKAAAEFRVKIPQLFQVSEATKSANHLHCQAPGKGALFVF
jgi:hypothetical protein